MVVWKKVQDSQMVSYPQSMTTGRVQVAVAKQASGLAVEAGHVRAEVVDGQLGGGVLERVDLGGDGDVLLGGGAVGDLGVDRFMSIDL